MLLPIANALTPVFLLIALGWALRRWAFFSPAGLQEIARLTYWVGLPCLLFSKIAGTPLSLAPAGDLLLVTGGATVAGIGLSYLAAMAIGIPWTATGTFVQAAFRGNLAFIGLPVIVYAFATAGDNARLAETNALLVFGPMVALYNIAAVLVLLLSRDSSNRQALRRMLKELLLNPLLLACLAGALYSACQWPQPLLLTRSFTALGQLALPLALLCLGGSLTTLPGNRHPGWPAGAAVIKTTLIPLLGLLFARGLGLDAPSTQIALLLLACPTAAASYVLVNQLGGDDALAASAILFSTVLAAPALALIIALT